MSTAGVQPTELERKGARDARLGGLGRRLLDSHAAGRWSFDDKPMPAQASVAAGHYSHWPTVDAYKLDPLRGIWESREYVGVPAAWGVAELPKFWISVAALQTFVETTVDSDWRCNLCKGPTHPLVRVRKA